MDPFGNSNRLALSSAYGGGAEHPEQTGTGANSDQTYFVGQLNVSCNSNDSAGYFDMPEYVTDMYLQALDGGDESNAALRQISDVYGPKADAEQYDMNFNHNVNPEYAPNEGCGCTGSYNGGAGGGTASCGCEGRAYESGFKDKKRDPACCCCPDDTYQRGLANKKPSPDNVGAGSSHSPPVYCAPCDSERPVSSGCGCNDNTYQRELPNKKPNSECSRCTVDYKYVPPNPVKPVYCPSDDPSCCGCSVGGCNPGPDTYELIRNKDAQRYQGKGPDRSNFYADDACDCPPPPQRCNNSCNNNFEIMNVSRDLNWTEARHAAYYLAPSACPPSSLTSGRRTPWLEDLSERSPAVRGKNVMAMSFSTAINNLDETATPVIETTPSAFRSPVAPGQALSHEVATEDEKGVPANSRCRIS